MLKHSGQLDFEALFLSLGDPTKDLLRQPGSMTPYNHGECSEEHGKNEER